MGRGDEMLAFQRLDTLSRGSGCLFSGCADSGSQPEESTATPILPILNPSPALCEIGNQREGSIFFAMCFLLYVCVRVRGAPTIRIVKIRHFADFSRPGFVFHRRRAMGVTRNNTKKTTTTMPAQP